MSLRSSLRLPREHGAWAMLYVPFVLGIAVAGRFTWSALFLLLSTTVLFISRESLLVWWRARSRGREAHDAAKMLALYLVLAAAFGLPLIFVWRLHWLLPIGVIGIALLLINGKQATQLEERSIAGESLAICGLTLTAPAAYYVTRWQWDKTAFWLWLLSALYFASSVFYIKLRIYRLNPRKQEQQRAAWQSCAYYHSFLLLALTALVFFGNLGVIDGREQVIHVERAGATIAELPVFDDKPYPSTVAAEEDTVVLYLDKSDVRSLCLKHPQIALAALKLLAGRLRKCAELVEALSLREVDQRLARWLISEARARGSHTPSGIEITLILTNQQIAAHIYKWIDGVRFGPLRLSLTRQMGHYLRRVQSRSTSLRNIPRPSGNFPHCR